ncbi:MAG: xylulokinase [Paracoccaceae bacterium]
MYLGLDLGTSGLKGLLIDGDQRVVGSATAALSVVRPKDGWSEQKPEAWISACRSVLAGLSHGYPKEMAALRGIGLSGQMHGATLVDRKGRAIRPAILWNDTRAHAEAAALDALPFMRDVTGSIVFPGFTAPKLNWLRGHERPAFDRIDKVLLPKDFLRLWLTGDAVSEMSDASGTSWLDVRRRSWSDDALAATGLTRDHMPALVEGSEVSGTVRAALAEEFGLPAGVRVAGGGGDNAASAIGTGVVGEGDAFLSLGTSGVLFAANDGYRPNPASAVHTFCHALPGKWHQMGVILAASDALNWFSGILQTPAHDLTAALGANLQPPGRTRFLPYLGGERTPHNDATIRAGFVGLSHADDRNALVRAVLEGVAFAFRDCQEALSAAGTRIGQCLAVGGGTRSDYWLKLLATVLNVRIELPENGEHGGSFGAARLAIIASGGATVAEACTKPPIARTIEPDLASSEAFQAAYEDYRALYPALKAL